MTRRQPITSTRNERLKAVRRLRVAGTRRRSDVFIVEGHRQLAAALNGGATVREVLTAPDLFLGEHDSALVGRAEHSGARVLELTARAFRSVAGQVRPDGIVAAVERWPTELARLGNPSLLLVVVGIERPGNLGALIRTADCAGAEAVVVCDGRTDVFHPETVRGSVGTLFHLPLATASTPAALCWLAERHARVVVATPDGRRLHPEGGFDATGAIAIVVGGERYGVGDVWLDTADETVRIPMHGRADSLNVAVAAGIVLFEAARQRASATAR